MIGVPGVPVPRGPGEPGAQHVPTGADPANVQQHQVALQAAPRLPFAAARGAHAHLGGGRESRRTLQNRIRSKENPGKPNFLEFNFTCLDDAQSPSLESGKKSTTKTSRNILKTR